MKLINIPSFSKLRLRLQKFRADGGSWKYILFKLRLTLQKFRPDGGSWKYILFKLRLTLQKFRSHGGFWIYWRSSIFRVDYVFGSEEFFQGWRLEKFIHYPSNASDHNFVLAEFASLSETE